MRIAVVEFFGVLASVLQVASSRDFFFSPAAFQPRHLAARDAEGLTYDHFCEAGHATSSIDEPTSIPSEVEWEISHARRPGPRACPLPTNRRGKRRQNKMPRQRKAAEAPRPAHAPRRALQQRSLHARLGVSTNRRQTTIQKNLRRALTTTSISTRSSPLAVQASPTSAAAAARRALPMACCPRRPARRIARRPGTANTSRTT